MHAFLSAWVGGIVEGLMECWKDYSKDLKGFSQLLSAKKGEKSFIAFLSLPSIFLFSLKMHLSPKKGVQFVT